MTQTPIHEHATLYRRYLDKDSADKNFNLLMEGVLWHDMLKDDEGTLRKVNGRKMAYHSNKASIYHYANLNLEGAMWNVETLQLVWMINDEFNLNLNSVLLNLYPTGKSEIRWHSDKEKQLGDDPIIPTLNLGASRIFSFRNIGSGEDRNVMLNHGDLLIMERGCQKNWLHAVLKDTSVTEPRISLTFREVYEN